MAAAVAQWQPDQGILQQCISMLEDTSNTSREVQLGVTDRLNHMSKLPDYTSYLTYIFTHFSPNEFSASPIAGIIVKNEINEQHNSIPTQSIEYIKSVIFPVLRSSDEILRRTAGLVVVALLNAEGLEGWPQGVMELINMMNSQDPSTMEGAFNVFAKLSEDMPQLLETCTINGMRPIEGLIPGWIQAAEYHEKRIRAHALNSLNRMTDIASPTLLQHIDSYIQALFRLASDPEANVRRFVCQAFVCILGARPDKLIPELRAVVDYMIYSTQDKDEDTALEACEFWLEFAEDDAIFVQLAPYLGQILPVLLKCMVYSEEDLMIMGGDEDDADVPDRPEDIRPRHYGGADHRNERLDENGQPIDGQGTSKSRAVIDAEFDAEEEDYDDDDDEEDDESVGEWNLRKCSAAALDVLALKFNDAMLETLFPHLKDRIFSQEWMEREVGILALGAIAEGCIGGVEPHLPTLIPFLINSLNDSKPLVRSIACWTLGRYCRWCIADTSEQHLNTYFIPLMEGLLRMVLDGNKRVQEAGCSAFATLEEEAGPIIAPYLGPVLTGLVTAFQKYQRKNLLILYDAIGTLADSVGAALNRPEYINILLPPLIQKWQALSNEDADLIPLLECLSSVTIAVGEGFAPFAQPVFQRCVLIVDEVIKRYQAGTADEYDDGKTFVIVALDLLSGLTQGLQGLARELVGSTQPSILPLLSLCVQTPESSIRQSAYALLGDLAISAFDLLRPSLPQIMPELVSQIEDQPQPENVSVCNNAAWATGEIALQYGSDPELHQWVPPLMERLVPVLLNPKSVKSLTENAAVTIGRLGLVCPELVAPHLEIFIERWCQALWDIKDNEEKDSAFRGLCQMIKVNPNGVAKSFVYFCMAVVRWTTPSAELNNMFISILTGFKDMSGAQWEEQKKHFPPLIVQRLQSRYGL
ncbi:ARM repeat-containing protein [Tilletiaria anomala UBC 951]|uniref:ARM repeat-containing protein n=1 Tax=Tilletiaria anomala (strain ATCC 24038 / CBS 436.72 / UBC 951) TaxID=1037660 RepID=A0A066VHU3_TILAU|nr:ARM repeat-containing protein [Tilletiaria anomala UBC 951]KDN41076.1 ARM repeat-containing protein [Tilletiaria anomala UBC 951]